MKRCIKCDKEKDDECFRYGKVMRTDCRDCHNEWRREAAKKHKADGEKIKKSCTECKIEKTGTSFAYGLNICKKCKSERDKEEKHRASESDPPKTCVKCEKEQAATEFRYQSRVCLGCEKSRLYEWRKTNPEKFKDLCKSYRSKDESKVKRSKYLREKYADDMNFRLEKLYRNRVRNFIKGGSKKGNEKYKEMLGCSWDTLRAWLEHNMVEGMTWENYGTVWHVDHTMPCAIFDFGVEENIKSCFNWSNLAPMFGPENLSKSDKLNMTLVASQKQKAIAFIKEHKGEILTDSLPAELRGSIAPEGDESVVLDTKAPAKAGAGV